MPACLPACLRVRVWDVGRGVVGTSATRACMTLPPPSPVTPSCLCARVRSEGLQFTDPFVTLPSLEGALAYLGRLEEGGAELETRRIMARCSGYE